jgi:hypothetical protein
MCRMAIVYVPYGHRLCAVWPSFMCRMATQTCALWPPWIGPHLWPSFMYRMAIVYVPYGHRLTYAWPSGMFRTAIPAHEVLFMSKRTNKLRFASGRCKHVVLSRYDLARRVCTNPAGEWLKLDPEDEGAAVTLAGWGMIERHHQTPQYVRWSPLHERPTFGRARRLVKVWGVDVGHVTQEQSMLLTLAEMATRKGGAHDVLATNDRHIQRKVRALEARGLLDVERKGRVWRLTISAARRALLSTASQNHT